MSLISRQKSWNHSKVLLENFRNAIVEAGFKRITCGGTLLSKNKVITGKNYLLLGS